MHVEAVDGSEGISTVKMLGELATCPSLVAVTYACEIKTVIPCNPQISFMIYVWPSTRTVITIVSFNDLYGVTAHRHRNQ